MAKISFIWQHFDKINKYEAKCKICKKIYKTSGNTSNLRIHLEKLHNVQKSVPVSTYTIYLVILCNKFK